MTKTQVEKIQELAEDLQGDLENLTEAVDNYLDAENSEDRESASDDILGFSTDVQATALKLSEMFAKVVA